MSLAQRLRQLMQQRRVTAADLARRSGLTPATISRYLLGGREPNYRSLKRLADALHVTVEALSNDGNTQRQETVDRSILRDAVNEFCSRVDIVAGPPLTLPPIPLISRASASTGVFADQKALAGAAEEHLERPPEFLDKQGYALRIEGDAMSPRLLPGDIIVASPKATFTSGDLCVVNAGPGGLSVKKVIEREGHYLLQATNPAVEPVMIAKSDVQFIHKVVWIRPK